MRSKCYLCGKASTVKQPTKGKRHFCSLLHTAVYYSLVRVHRPFEGCRHLGGNDVYIILPDKLEERFRETVFKRKGMKRGNMTKAVQEAIQLWVETESNNVS